MSEYDVPPPPAPGAVKELGNCLSWAGGFALGFIGAALVIGFLAGGAVHELTNSSVAPGIALLVVSIAVIFFAIRFSNQEVRLLQGLLIGSAVASLLTGLCGAILLLAK